ncbi:MAG TPA: PH domain-containing protein [Hanamia sp.]|nr:PH domain-containing protein [Hanamia sp.]
MQNQLVPVDRIEAEVKPEKIYATLFLTPYILIAFIISISAIWFNALYLILLSIPFVVLGLYKYFLIISSTFYLTDQQLIIQRGVFTKTVNYLELYRIKDILVEQPFWMKALGLMNITLLSFDKEESLLVLKGIKISDLPQSIRNHVQECRQRNKVLTIDN